jgi:transcriptional regulator with XRE-family HTH domain
VRKLTYSVVHDVLSVMVAWRVSDLLGEVLYRPVPSCDHRSEIDTVWVFRREDRMFADRLNMLFEDSPRFGRPVTQAVVADGLAASGSRISRPYLSQLRRSRRMNPSAEVVAALAEFFGVEDEFFYLPISGAGADSSVVIDCLEQASLQRLLASVDGLSELSTGLVVDMAERLRRAEKLPESTAGAD